MCIRFEITLYLGSDTKFTAMMETLGEVLEEEKSANTDPIEHTEADATAQLIDSIVETDKETGQTSLKIPVPDKQTVRNLLDIVGKLFG